MVPLFPPQDRARQLLDSSPVSKALSQLTHSQKSDGSLAISNSSSIPDDANPSSSALPETRLPEISSSSSSAASQSTPSSPSKKPRKQSLVPTVDDPRASSRSTSTSNRFRFDPATLQKLERLLVEGELLEVSMEETRSIWRLLSASSSTSSSTFGSNNKGDDISNVSAMKADNDGSVDIDNLPGWIRVFPESEHLLHEDASGGKAERKKRKSQKLLGSSDNGAGANNNGHHQRPISRRRYRG